MPFPKLRVIALSVLMAAPLIAQTYTVIQNNDSVTASPNAPLTAGPDGNFYGTTTQGRTYGTVFKITPSGSITTLHVFNNTDGSTPYGGLVFGADGYMYGTTAQGGTYGAGTVFKISTAGSFSSLYSLTSSSEGARPIGKLVQASDGNFYGLTFQGGSNGCGTIYQITSSGTFTAIHQFNCRYDGGSPRDGLILSSDGNLYGTTSSNGVYGLGSVFKITLDGTITLLHHFTSSEGNSPYAGLLQASDGKFYGTTWQGGSSGNGTVFRMTADGAIATLHSFSGTEGKNPAAPLIEGADGNFYGTAYHGGDAIYGTVFAVNRSGAMTRLHSFTGSDGQYPAAALLEQATGTFFGTTYQGGLNNKGVVFSVAYSAPMQPPSINPGGVVPVYSTSSLIQSGEWVSIFGNNLAAKTTLWKGDFPTTLGGVTVTVGGQKAFLWYVSPDQINLQVPDGVPDGDNSVVVTTASGSGSLNVGLAQASPSFCLLDGKHLAGIIVRSDGSGAYGNGGYDIIGPADNSLGYQTASAKAGDSVVLFGVGFGPTNPAVPAGQAFSGAARAVNSVSVRINGVSVTPTFAGLSSAGLYQLNLVLPSGLGSGDLPIQASVAGAETQPGTIISLQ